MPLAIQLKKKLDRNRIWAVVIGGGLALSPIHNQWLTNLVTQNGEVGFFLPAFGVALWLMGALAYVYDNWGKLTLGSRWIWIPMLVILASFLPHIIIDPSKQSLSSLLFGVSLFAVYITARLLGIVIFRMLIPFVAIGTIIAVVNGVLNTGQPSGGLITNYAASAGFLVFGAMVNQGKWQWILIAVALIGLFFIGALEGVFVVAILSIAVIARRDFSKSFLIVAGVLLAFVVLWAVQGFLFSLYKGNDNIQALVGGLASGILDLDAISSGRWSAIVVAMQNFKFWGHGYTLSLVSWGTVHNIPLIIVHQLGIPAAIAWSVATVYCLIKTKWKYAWIAVMAMSVWDHYLWTQFAPYWWALAGVSTASTITTDTMFRTK